MLTQCFSISTSLAGGFLVAVSLLDHPVAQIFARCLVREEERTLCLNPFWGDNQ